MSQSLWGGRFVEPIDRAFDAYQSSLRFDARLLVQDLAGSIAHAQMLTSQAIISEAEGAAIVSGLRELHRLALAGDLTLPPDAEDVHTAVESLLRERIGAVAGKLHTARSRNDQVVTDTRLFVRDATTATVAGLVELRRALIDQAELHLASRNGGPAMLPGFTHLQTAQPLHLSHWLLAYQEMLARDTSRFIDAAKRADQCPLGAAALCGTSWPIDRHQTADALGFAAPMRNSVDAVSSRDFAVDFLAACSSLTITLSRFAEDLIIYSTREFGFVVMPDALSTGSSIMPQKKNADLCELTRAKAGRVAGRLMSLLTVLKGLPTAYNKDLQEDKEAIFDAFDTVAPLLPLWTKLIRGLRWQIDVMARKAEGGFATATDLADGLAQRGLPFREAHEIVGRLVAHCDSLGKAFSEVSLEELAAIHPALDRELVAAAAMDIAAERRCSFGGSSAALIATAIAVARRDLNIQETAHE